MSIVKLIVLMIKELSHRIYDIIIEINFYDYFVCLQMKFEETKDKLEKYRKKKLQEEAQKDRRQYLWDIVTLQPLRRNLSNNVVEPVAESENDDEHNDDSENDDNSKERRWTRIDWAIFCVKVLVWASMQMIFVKIEFGSVFFLVSCILLMTSNLGRR